MLKVCGMREKENIATVAALGVDYMGFIFYEKSKRFVGEDFEEELLKPLGDSIEKVGVFVNATLEYVKEKQERYDLDLLQLHGDESPAYCEALQAGDIQIVKVFSVGEDFDFEKLVPYESACDFYLFDTKSPQRGGTGIAFDWEILRGYSSKKPLFLSGGISLDNLERVKELDFLPIHALDVNSKFEIEPALKDVEKVKELIEQSKKLGI